jgi:hypothetical protein
MKNIKATGEKITENRQELANKYFDIGSGQGGLGVYAVGNLGIVTLLSDLQEQIRCGFDKGSAEHYRQILNDIKCILITDEENKEADKENENKKLHEALRVVADSNVDYLSYKGQEKWNTLSKEVEKKG